MTTGGAIFCLVLCIGLQGIGLGLHLRSIYDELKRIADALEKRS